MKISDNLPWLKAQGAILFLLQNPNYTPTTPTEITPGTVEQIE